MFITAVKGTWSRGCFLAHSGVLLWVSLRCHGWPECECRPAVYEFTAAAQHCPLGNQGPLGGCRFTSSAVKLLNYYIGNTTRNDSLQESNIVPFEISQYLPYCIIFTLLQRSFRNYIFLEICDIAVKLQKTARLALPWVPLLSISMDLGKSPRCNKSLKFNVYELNKPFAFLFTLCVYPAWALFISHLFFVILFCSYSFYFAICTVFRKLGNTAISPLIKEHCIIS